MDNAARLQYLQAMGIDVWVPRTGVPVESVAGFQVGEAIFENESKETDWVGFQEQVDICQKCSLHQSAKQKVFAEGNVQADWMLIGDAPGQDEELEGKPFAGQVGLLLSEMIRALGLQRDEVYITNIVKCRPVDDKQLKVEEMATCYDYLQQQIAWVNPRIIIVFGRVAAQKLLKTQDSLSKLRGVTHYLESIPLVVVYHPAYLLRKLLEKRKAWQDLQSAITIYQEKHE